MKRPLAHALNALLVLAALGVTFAVALAVDSRLNLGLRYAIATLFQKNVQEPEPIMYVYDNDTGWKLNPRTQYHRSREGPFLGFGGLERYDARLRVNSEGFLDRDHYLATPYYRIAFAGNSWVEAVQVEFTNRFAPLTEDYVFARSDQRKVAEIMNFGMSNAAPAQAYGILKTYALKYKPDEVWLFVTAADLRANTPVDTPPPFGPTFVFADAAHSRLSDIRFGYVDPPAYSVAKRQKELEKAAMVNVDFRRVMAYHYSPERDPVYDRVWHDMELTLGLIRATLQSAGVRMRLVYIPPRYEVDPKLWEQWARDTRKAVGHDIAMDPVASDKRFAALASSLGIDYLSLTALCKEKGPAEMYADHFSRMGHHWVAELLAKTIIDTAPAERLAPRP